MTALFNQAVQAHQSGKLSEAESLYRQIIAQDPKNFDALHMLGIVCSSTGKIQEADGLFRAALSIDPGFPPCHVNYGFCLLKQKQFNEAVESFDKALALFPHFAEAWLGRGNALRELKRGEDALAAYAKAIALKPNLAEAYAGRGKVLSELKRHDEAIAAYDKALSCNPNLEFVAGERLHWKMRLCDWSNFGSEREALVASVRGKKPYAQPFAFLSISSSPEEQLECAKLWISEKYQASARPIWDGEIYNHDRIRVAYISADFRQHPVAVLIAGLIEGHSREGFDVTGISLRPEEASEMGQRMKRAFDRFIDASVMTNQDIARLIRQLEIDIAIDLMGFTEGSRTEILAQRAAPIQVNYLGFPGTMGANYIDYLIADHVVIPHHQQKFYSEKIIYMPDSFQANDRGRPLSSNTFTRQQLGLPAEAFVFCCFNNNYKITPAVFDVWMRTLNRVRGSVLWLVASDKPVQKNLRTEAAARGVHPGRLIFAERVPYAEYLSRLSAADLFLDTAPYNAGATASDALWAGLPVLTCQCDVFVGRMGASLLSAIGLPELVTATPQAYEELAVELAASSGKLREIKDKLDRNRLTAPLFDTQLFTRHIERAYAEMYRRHRAGLPPDHIHVGQ
jgi:protein O-GlcNAc transferase